MSVKIYGTVPFQVKQKKRLTFVRRFFIYFANCLSALAAAVAVFGTVNGLFLAFVLNGSLSGSQTGNRYAERRAGNVIQTDFVKELDGF